MKRVLSFIAVAVLTLAPAAFAADAGTSQTLTGKISDSHCNMDHSMATHGGKMDDAACVNACVKGGAKYVLADKDNNKVYQIKNQAKAKSFAGKAVKVTGNVSGDTVTVEKIEAMP